MLLSMLDCCCTCWLLIAIVTVIAVAVIDWWFHRRCEDPPASLKSVFVTGCDSGFGRRLVERLSGKGWTVFATCLTDSGESELREMPGVIPLRLDIRDESAVDAAVATTESEIRSRGLQGLWGVVNNAGISCRKVGPISFVSPQDLRDVLEVNLVGMQTITRAFLPLLLRSRGRLVNTSSMGGRLTMPDFGAYSTTKFGVEALCDSYRRELIPFGVKVACVEPGGFQTQFTRLTAIIRSIELGFDEAPEALRAAYGNEYKLKCVQRMQQPTGFISNNLDAVADAYELALTSVRPRARYMVGWDAKFLYWPLSVLPECITDAIIYHSSIKPQGTVA